MEDETRFVVVVNAEEQYSLWSAETSPPGGWRAIGAPGTREECLAWIEDNWTDMRPKSVRDRLASGGAGAA